MAYVLAEVLACKQLSKHMKRITLFSDSFSDFPDVGPGAYIKLLFNHDGTPLKIQQVSSDRPIMRTYTIQALNKKCLELTLDIALHQNNPQQLGIASSWASTVTPGQEICLAGPGSAKGLANEFDWVLFAGDMTAMPAIESHLSALPSHTIGHAVLSVAAQEDIREIAKPKGVELHWLVNNSESLACALAKLPLPQGTPAIWAASEFSEMRAMRVLFNDHWHIPRSQYYLSSYWKKGRTEDQHKVDKQNDLATQS